MTDYYQHEYTGIRGRGSMLPSQDEFELFLASHGRAGPTSYETKERTLHALGIGPGAKVLDYGASWGCGTWQLREAGYDARGYEVSLPRAQFGREALGLQIDSNKTDLSSDYAAVYANHVIEHVSNPTRMITENLERLVPNGFLIIDTPNGGSEYRCEHAESFHRLWGQMHPQLVQPSFITWVVGARPVLMGTALELDEIKSWLEEPSTRISDCSGFELKIVIRKSVG